MRYLLLLLLLYSTNAVSTEQKKPYQLHWEFDGIFGNFDRQAAQRGFQVWKEVCAACHSMNLVAYRNLMDLGFSEEEVKALAETANVTDGPNEQGEMFERPGRLSDRIGSPYPNVEAARAANGGRYPVDHSLIIKARPDGPNYIYSLLVGYQDPPKGVKIGKDLHYNPFFPGGQIGMPPPLSDGMVAYQDGTPATLEQMARDLVVFLHWAAEPEMEKRKKMGLKVLLYLAIFTILFYFIKKAIWKKKN